MAWNGDIPLVPGSKWQLSLDGDLEGLRRLFKNYKSTLLGVELYDEVFDRQKHVSSIPATCGMYALANKQFAILDWLEEQGAKKHKFLYRNVKYAREIIDPYYDAWIE